MLDLNTHTDKGLIWDKKEYHGERRIIYMLMNEDQKIRTSKTLANYINPFNKFLLSLSLSLSTQNLAFFFSVIVIVIVI